MYPGTLPNSFSIIHVNGNQWWQIYSIAIRSSRSPLLSCRKSSTLDASGRSDGSTPELGAQACPPVVVVFMNILSGCSSNLRLMTLLRNYLPEFYCTSIHQKRQLYKVWDFTPKASFLPNQFFPQFPLLFGSIPFVFPFCFIKLFSCLFSGFNLSFFPSHFLQTVL